MAAPNAAVLDHRGFPHLIDMILGYADRGTLVAVRTTCTAMRDKADARLLHHMAVNSAGELVDPDGGRPPALYRLVNRRQNGSTTWTMTARQKRLLGLVRVLDIAQSYIAQLPPIEEDMSGVHMLRMAFSLRPQVASITCPVVVLFRTTEGMNTRNSIIQHIPGVRKVVCNVMYTSGATVDQRFCVYLPPSVSELVVMYTPFSPRIQPPLHDWNYGVTNSTISVIARHAIAHDTETWYTLVGLPILEEWQRVGDDTPVATPAEAQERFLQLLGEAMAKFPARTSEATMKTLQAVKAAKEHVRFLTRAEYARRLTPEGFYLETTLPPTMSKGI